MNSVPVSVPGLPLTSDSVTASVLATPPPVSPIQGVAVPGAPDEPVLDVNDIQGNILVGFNKDHQTFLFFQIEDATNAKTWMRELTPHIATVAESLADRRLFRALRARRGTEAPTTSATWVNIAFTNHGIAKLTSPEEMDKFTSDPFKQGMPDRAGILGDPTDAQGNPTGWVVGAKDNYPDVLLIVAGDSRPAMKAEEKRIRATIAAHGEALRLIYRQEGATLPGALSGHEHFGFKDGVSQPGIRGRVSDMPLDFLTPRAIAPEDPAALRFARPGQPLVWPGEFVLGERYPVQSFNDDLQPGQNAPPEPAWTANGSFLVFRRLRQDVAAFHQFAAAQSARLAAKYPDTLSGLTPERFASLLVGRWPSGTPIMRSPLQDDPDLAANPMAVNHFNFSNPTDPVALAPGLPPDTFAQAPDDFDGLRCPYAAHIRKVNPRDDVTDLGGPERTLPKRLLRRGIAFGKPAPNPPRAGRDRAERGLLFVSYQAFIDDQFEFLCTDWTNSDVNPRSYQTDAQDANGGLRLAGHDPVIGQQPQATRERTFTLRIDATTFEEISVPIEWVFPTGGGYFFAPSITALQTVLTT